MRYFGLFVPSFFLSFFFFKQNMKKTSILYNKMRASFTPTSTEIGEDDFQKHTTENQISHKICIKQTNYTKSKYFSVNKKD